jgi:DNA-binding beta-propeller fold protein YncE
MFSAGCSNGEISPGSPVVSHPALGVAPIEIPARNTQVSYLYVADSANSENGQVDFLLRKNVAKGIVGEKRKRIQYPDGIFIDPSGTLYVANELDSGVFGWVPSGVAVFPPAPFGPEF